MFAPLRAPGTGPKDPGYFAFLGEAKTTVLSGFAMALIIIAFSLTGHVQLNTPALIVRIHALLHRIFSGAQPRAVAISELAFPLFVVPHSASSPHCCCTRPSQSTSQITSRRVQTRRRRPP